MAAARRGSDGDERHFEMTCARHANTSRSLVCGRETRLLFREIIRPGDKKNTNHFDFIIIIIYSTICTRFLLFFFFNIKSNITALLNSSILLIKNTIFYLNIYLIYNDFVWLRIVDVYYFLPRRFKLGPASDVIIG